MIVALDIEYAERKWLIIHQTMIDLLKMKQINYDFLISEKATQFAC